MKKGAARTRASRRNPGAPPEMARNLAEMLYAAGWRFGPVEPCAPCKQPSASRKRAAKPARAVPAAPPAPPPPAATVERARRRYAKRLPAAAYREARATRQGVAPDRVAAFDLVWRSLWPTGRATLAERFDEWAEEHPQELSDYQIAYADKATRRMLREQERYERMEREGMRANPSRARAAAKPKRQRPPASRRSVERAARLREAWTGRAASRVDVASVDHPGERVTATHEIVAILYEEKKHGDRRRTLYRHAFEGTRPLLCTRAKPGAKWSSAHDVPKPIAGRAVTWLGSLHSFEGVSLATGQIETLRMVRGIRIAADPVTKGAHLVRVTASARKCAEAMFIKRAGSRYTVTARGFVR